MVRRLAAVVLLAATGGLLAVAVAASSGAQATIGVSAKTTTPSTPGTAVGDAAELDAVDLFTDFFTSLSGDPPNRGNVDARVVPDSPAAEFVDYLYGFATARLDSRPGPLEPFTVERSATAIGGAAAVDVCSDGYCDQFSDFAVDDAGRLETFLLNGTVIDDRLGAATEAEAFGSITVGIVGAFERVTVDELAVVLAITPAGERLTVVWEDARYVDPERGELEVDLAASAYPRDITPVGTQTVVLQFPAAALGGEVVFSYTTESSPEPMEVRVTVDERQP